MILSLVFVLMLYNQSVDRIKMFLNAFAVLFRSRQKMTPKISVSHLEKKQVEELKKVFDV